jgi:hypothetical protein
MIQNKRNKDAVVKHKKVTTVYGSKQLYSYSLI